MTTPAPRHDHQDVPRDAQDVPDVPGAAGTSWEVPEDVPDVLDALAGPALHAQLRADRALIAGAAAALRHAATQDGYRGRPGPDRAYAIASVLDLARVRWRDQDPDFRARIRTCSRILLDVAAPPPTEPEPGPHRCPRPAPAGPCPAGVRAQRPARCQRLAGDTG